MSEPGYEVERRCGWWVRWYHARLRRADQWFLKARLSQLTASEAEFNRVWDIVKQLPGQEHWQCECSRKARP